MSQTSECNAVQTAAQVAKSNSPQRVANQKLATNKWLGAIKSA
jgi:hypothetical protein